MESYNPTSQTRAQSNIVPFQAPAPRSAPSSTDTIWTRLWDGLFQLLAPKTEPRISQKRESDGNDYYHVYDPVTGVSRTFGSEQETRIWLDRRFYENPRNW
jgi:hypothetical protein